MQITITAKIKIYTNKEQSELFKDVSHTYKKACNFVSEEIFKTKNLSQAS